MPTACSSCRLGVIGVAIGVVLLPDLSRKLRAGDAAGALTPEPGARSSPLFLTLPAAVALIVIGRPILHAVFEHGAFTREATLQRRAGLAAFAAGLPAFIAHQGVPAQLLCPRRHPHADVFRHG